MLIHTVLLCSVYTFMYMYQLFAPILYLLYLYSLSTVPTEVISSSLQDEISVLFANKYTTRLDMSDWLAGLFLIFLQLILCGI